MVVDDQAPANPSLMTEAHMRAILSQTDQAMSTQAQATTVQAQAMTSQANWDVAPRVHEQTMVSPLRNFTHMNPSIFYGSKVYEDPQELVDEVYKILCFIRLSSNKNAKLASYKLMDVALTWHVQWRYNRSLNGAPVTLEIFKRDFLDLLFPREMREA